MRIFSIFRSISGEMGLFHQGSPAIFVRLAGCNARCKWCDTIRSQPLDSGQEMSVKNIVDEVLLQSKDKRVLQVLITGGEPLLQTKELEELVSYLAVIGYQIQVETNGSLLPSKNLRRDVDWWVVDYKLPSSSQEQKMQLFCDLWTDFGVNSNIKFVCADIVDFMKACEMVHKCIEGQDAYFVLFSACPPLTHKELLGWMEEYTNQFPWLIQASLNVQIHKLIGLVEDSA